MKRIIDVSEYQKKIDFAALKDSGKGDNAGTPDHIGIVIAVDKNKGRVI